MVAPAGSSSDSTRDVIAGCHARLDRHPKSPWGRSASSNQGMWLGCETDVITSALHFSHRYPRRIAPFCITIRFFSPGRRKHRSEKPIPKKSQSDIGFLRANSPSSISPLPHSGHFIFVGLELMPCASISGDTSRGSFLRLR